MAIAASGSDEAVLRVANCSGFYGDRLSAAREMVDGGPIDVLTGDWLAELTMLLLARSRARRAGGGYARTFLVQMEQVLGTCLDRGIKVVSNAGGLDPVGCAAAVEELAARLGLPVRVACVTGDDLTDRLGALMAAGHDLANSDTGEKLADLDVTPVTANAYLGGRPIAEALRLGADVVVTGRVTDAALVVGPGIWHFGWDPFDLDALAGAVVAGHVIECGCQATGGNYAFFREVPDLARAGFPLAELHADGSSVITKHPGTGGLVSVGTVTAQLLYEIGGPRYPNPDVVARFDTIELEQVGDDRVRVSGVRGEPPPADLKVALNYVGGYRNTMTLLLPGLDTTAKADVAEETIWARIPGGRDAFEQVAVDLVGEGSATAPALLRITVMDSDEAKVGRAFSAAVVETGLASFPGFHALAPPGDASPYGVFWPALVPASTVQARVVMREVTSMIATGTSRQGMEASAAIAPKPSDAAAALPAETASGFSPDAVAPTADANSADAVTPATAEIPLKAMTPTADDIRTNAVPPTADANSADSVTPIATEVSADAVAPTTGEISAGAITRIVDDIAEDSVASSLAGQTSRAPLGAVVGARSGDKGGNANLGVWVRTPEAFGWLDEFLTVDRLRDLVPDSAGLRVERHPFPNLLALNFMIVGLLGRGVAASTRLDAQAKGLGEELRASLVDVPTDLLSPASGDPCGPHH